MAKGNFQPALADVLVHEGGYTADPRDPGNWTGGKRGVGLLKGTKKGISAAAFPHLEIKNLTDSQIADIYHGKYWVPIRGDDLPAGVDLSAMDYGVNSGVSRSAKDLQRVLGVDVDGRVGPVTLLAAKALSWVSSKAQLEADAKAARDKAVAQGGGAAVGTGSGVGVDQAPDLSGLPVWAIVAVVAVVVAPLIIRAIVNAQRASALAQAAKEA